jgi:hypothetical protein
MRASPSLHTVKKHTRDNGTVKVESYKRGIKKPKETQKLSGLRIKQIKKPHDEYKVHIAYSGHGGISETVKANTYQSSLEKGVQYARETIKSITLTEVKN